VRRRRYLLVRLAGPADVFGPAGDQHAQALRHDVEPLGDVLADRHHRRAAARAALVGDVERGLDARQYGGQRAEIARPRWTARGVRRLARDRLVERGHALGVVLEAERQLVGAQRLRAPPEAMAVEHGHQRLQLLVLELQRRQLTLRQREIAGARHQLRLARGECGL